MTGLTEEIIWHDVITDPPCPIKNKGPLITKRKGQFPYGVWWRMTGHEDEDGMSGRKYKYWSSSRMDILYWAEVKGPIDE